MTTLTLGNRCFFNPSLDTIAEQLGVRPIREPGKLDPTDRTIFDTQSGNRYWLSDILMAIAITALEGKAEAEILHKEKDVSAVADEIRRVMASQLFM